MRSTRSRGMSGIVEAVRGEGRTGRVGFVSILKDRIKESESGIGAPLALKGELGPPRFRLIVTVGYFVFMCPSSARCICHGLRPSCRSACPMKGQVCRCNSKYYIRSQVSVVLVIYFRRSAKEVQSSTLQSPSNMYSTGIFRSMFLCPAGFQHLRGSCAVSRNVSWMSL